MEQVVVIAVFAVCAAVCVKILVVSYLMTVDAVDTKNALLVAESAAESYKAFSGDIGKAAEALGGGRFYLSDYGFVTVYFDGNWQPSSAEEASFVLYLAENDSEPLVMFADISVGRVTSGEEPVDELISLRTALRRNG